MRACGGLGGGQGLLEAAEADLVAVYDRDAACETYIQPLLFFKGYQALQSYRLAHWLWTNGQQVLFPKTPPRPPPTPTIIAYYPFRTFTSISFSSPGSENRCDESTTYD